jgi:hypothetical protein
MFAHDLLHEGVKFRPCLLNGHARFHPADKLQVLASATRVWLFQVITQRSIDLRQCGTVQPGKGSKGLRQHADDLVRLVAQAYGVPNDRWIATESTQPDAVREDRFVASFRMIFVGDERTTKLHLYPERIEVVEAYAYAFQQLRLPLLHHRYIAIAEE